MFTTESYPRVFRMLPFFYCTLCFTHFIRSSFFFLRTILFLLVFVNWFGTKQFLFRSFWIRFYCLFFRTYLFSPKVKRQKLKDDAKGISCCQELKYMAVNNLVTCIYEARDTCASNDPNTHMDTKYLSLLGYFFLFVLWTPVLMCSKQIKSR